MTYRVGWCSEKSHAEIEALVCIKGHVAADLSIPLRGHGHLLCRRFGNAVDTGYITEMVGLVRVFGIVQHLRKVVLQNGIVCCFLGIHRVINHAGDAVLDIPYLCNRHFIPQKSKAESRSLPLFRLNILAYTFALGQKNILLVMLAPLRIHELASDGLPDFYTVLH